MPVPRVRVKPGAGVGVPVGVLQAAPAPAAASAPAEAVVLRNVRLSIVMGLHLLALGACGQAVARRTGLLMQNFSGLGASSREKLARQEDENEPTT
jgi:hypothetical protein